jgi:CheY-like chemotaxis protein
MISEAKRAVILIVEDELLIRLNAVEMVEEAGFEVIEAASADEAIAILEGRLDIAVVFTDIQMPGSNGRSQACCCGSRPLASDYDRGHFGTRQT